jgi:hypothetical protein
MRKYALAFPAVHFERRGCHEGKKIQRKNYSQLRVAISLQLSGNGLNELCGSLVIRFHKANQFHVIERRRESQMEMVGLNSD